MIFFRSAAIAATLSLGSAPAWAVPAINVGDKLEAVTLRDEAGGRVDGSPWSSDTIKDKVWVLFYVSPSHRNDNEALKDALDTAKFDHDKFGSIAVINMAASWLPNSVLASSLKSNQERFPMVTYVKDMDKALVKRWHLADDDFDVLIFGKDGKVLMRRTGDFSEQNVKDTLDLIKRNMDAPKT